MKIQIIGRKRLEMLNQTTEGKFIVRRQIGIDAGHRVMTHGSKCRNMHGHRYTIEAHCQTDTNKLPDSGEQTDMVIDFSFLKDEMMVHIDEPCDHGFIISVFDKELLKMFTPNTEDHEIWYKKVKDEVDTNYFFSSCNTNLDNKIYVIKHQPTAERLAQHWYKRLFDPIKTRSEGNAILYKIRVWETPNCFADFINPNA